MKRLLASVALVIALTACVSRGDADRMQSQIDSLQRTVHAKEALIDDVFATIGTISETLEQIKNREGVLAMPQEEMADSSALNRLNEEVAAIDRLMAENRARIAELEQKAEQLRKANMKIKGLNKLIAELNSRMEAKDAEIDSLRNHIEEMGVRIAELNEEVEARGALVKELFEERDHLVNTIDAKTVEMNTAYYILASQKELLRDQVIVKKGFIGRTLTLNETPNLALFTPVDMRLFKTVPIGQKGVTVVTTHPEGSYWLVESETRKNEVESLVILDAEKFWSISKILVISYK